MTRPSPPFPAPVGPVGPVLIANEAIPDRRGIMAIMSRGTRHGEWVLARLFRVLTIAGRVDLDLTQVRIGSGISEIEIVSIMGEVRVVVPHNVRVECEGDATLGEFSLKRTATAVASPEAPLIRVTGTAFMGAVKVRVIDPAAPGWLDRWRARRR